MIWNRHAWAEVDGVVRCGIDVKLSLGDRDITSEFAVTEFDDEANVLTITLNEDGKPLNLGLGKSEQGPVPGEIIATDLEATPPFALVHCPDIVLSFEDPTP